MCLRLFVYIILFFLFVSCSETKYVSEGCYLLDDVEVKLDGKYANIDMDKMKSRVRQNGNSRWFSAL